MGAECPYAFTNRRKKRMAKITEKQTGEPWEQKLIHPPAWCDPARYLRRTRIERQVTADFRRQYRHNLWCGTQYLGYLCHIERCRSLRAAGQVRL